MSVNTQKLIIGAILLSFIIGTIGNIQILGDDISLSDAIEKENTYIENEERLMKTDEATEGGIISSVGEGFERTFGNMLSWGKRIWNFLEKGLNPWSLPNSEEYTEIESATITIIEWFRALMVGIPTIIEIYLVIKNKKTS